MYGCRRVDIREMMVVKEGVGMSTLYHSIIE